MAEQSGIDILCDAAGSDLLLGSLFPGAPPPQDHRRGKRLKLSADASTSASPHVCHICKKVYERADHLTRHLRSHENARPYQCSRCPKRFNRADLLTRHETTHDRDGGAKGRPIIRRSDRAAEACMNCAASKAKCDDQKPCSRCRTKNLDCQTATKRPTGYEASDVPTGSPALTNSTNDVTADVSGRAPIHLEQQRVHYMADPTTDLVNGVAAAPYHADYAVQQHTLMSATTEDFFFFNPTHHFLQDMELPDSWDLNFDSYTIPQIDIQHTSPQSTGTATSKHLTRNPTRGYAAFKRSPWLWEPKSKDSLGREQEGLMFNEKTVAQSPAYERMLSSNPSRLKMDAAIRDRLFASVLSLHKNSAMPKSKYPSKIPSFPSLELLNHLLQTHFIQDDYEAYSWIHAASFNPSKTIPELLLALISSGAGVIAVPAIWQFGLSLQEIVRIGLSVLFEDSNNKTRDLQCLQAYMLQIEIGLWSGFKRKMEIAESFTQPITTMLRRGGTFTGLRDTVGLIPSHADTPQELEAKWLKFVKRESFMRLVLHLFFHDAQASITVERNPLMTYTELGFSLPAARDLWRAPSAEAWREIYLRKKPLSASTKIPRMCELMSSITLLEKLEEFVDIELCYNAILYGYWGQICAYRESVRFYGQRITSTSSSSYTHRLWLTSQNQELYRDVSEFAMLISSSTNASPHLSVLAELLMMILHVSPGELQRFAGKQGEDEAGRAATSLEDNWAGSRDARHAVWHAGQVLRNARALPPTWLRGFNAIAVYLASLTLWIYGLLSCAGSINGSSSNHRQYRDESTNGYDLHNGNANHTYSASDSSSMLQPPGSTAESDAMPTSYVLVDGQESRETRAFLQLDKGMPGITLDGDVHGGVESLANPGIVLGIARNVFRGNFPVRSEPLPPLVESLGNLLRDLGSSPSACRPSRVPSRAASEDRVVVNGYGSDSGSESESDGGE